MRFAIWHSPRVGSTLLCNLLGATDVAGFADWEHCGFTIGFPPMPLPKTIFEKKVQRYFDNQRTGNGVAGTKLSLNYLRDIGNVVRLQWMIDEVLLRFDKHIVLSRDDKVAQAVSYYIAGSERHFNSMVADKRPPAKEKIDFKPYLIAHNMQRIAVHEAGYNTWLAELGIEPLRISYETMIANLSAAVHTVIQFLGIEDVYVYTPPLLQKQVDPRKADFIRQYREWRLNNELLQ